MELIADTNIFLAVALEEPEKEDIVKLTAGATLVGPEIIPYEIGNALSSLLKRRKLSVQQTMDALEITRKIPVRLVPVDIGRALDLAARFNIYAYDAYFIQCALKSSSPILTLDGRMKDVAKAMNIPVLE
jgi:predicted nucleic acid-binding protein